MNLKNHHNKAFFSLGLTVNAINSGICLYKVESKIRVSRVQLFQKFYHFPKSQLSLSPYFLREMLMRSKIDC